MAKIDPSARQREIVEAVMEHGSAAAAAAGLDTIALTIDRALPRRDPGDPASPCWTGGRPPAVPSHDGSPQYDHGHDPISGAVWSRSPQEDRGRLRPACCHEHPVLTTGRRCPACRAGDLTDPALDIFADLLPGGADATAALERHHRTLGRGAACDGSCGVPDCRRPDFDEAGLPRYRGRPSAEVGLLPARAETVELPVEDDYPASACEVD